MNIYKIFVAHSCILHKKLENTQNRPNNDKNTGSERIFNIYFKMQLWYNIFKVQNRGENMGCWGTGLHSNDIAEDILDMCKEIFPFVSVEEGIRMVLDEYKEIIDDTQDDDYANFWYVFADYLWKHGILTDEIKHRTLNLLENKAGMEIWYEDASQSDVKKRLAVLEKLEKQLKTQMPPQKIPKGRLSKPKFKAGDIIIFQAGPENDEYNPWLIDYRNATFMYSDPKIICCRGNLKKPLIANKKYMAILCVGSTKEQHTQYLPDLYDEKSEYAFYNYMSDKVPSVEDLQACGFLPCIRSVSEGESQKLVSYEWIYKFIFYTENFYPDAKKETTDLFVIHGTEEATRFHRLFDKKDYSKESTMVIGFTEAFERMWYERALFLNTEVQFDDLTDVNKQNPTTLIGKELRKALMREIEEDRDLE